MKKNYKGNMLLIELVIVILFFSLSQVVIVQVFAEAQRRTNSNARMNDALMQTESLIERLTGNEEAEVVLQGLGFEGEAGVYVFAGEGYDIEAGVRRLRQSAGDLVTVEFTARQGDEEMFTLPSVQYFSQEGRNE